MSLEPSAVFEVATQLAASFSAIKVEPAEGEVLMFDGLKVYRDDDCVWIAELPFVLPNMKKNIVARNRSYYFFLRDLMDWIIDCNLSSIAASKEMEINGCDEEEDNDDDLDYSRG